MSIVNPKDKYLDINGLRFHYLDWGTFGNQSMLLLHGFMAHARVWDDFALRLRHRYHILALDQRGHGESQWSKGAAYTLDDHFLDIYRFIETLGLDDLILVGHSMGGRNALFYAACAPAKIKRLILVDARPGNNQEASRALREHLATLPLQADSLDEVVRAIQTLYPNLPQDICLNMANHGYKKAPGGEYIPKYDVRMGLQAERSGYTAEDLWPFLENITCPTLIVQGEQSRFVSSDDANRMHRILPRAELNEIPEATHLPVLENPPIFYKVLSDFLEEKH
jgi:pimeloyl-ACP methyl ester carboxylesterase